MLEKKHNGIMLPNTRTDLSAKSFATSLLVGLVPAEKFPVEN